MKSTHFAFAAALLCITAICPATFAQNCTALPDSLKGTYTGNCKNGVAHGQGAAKGAHSYEGKFKNGLPHGKGVYTWPNGSTFKGWFEEGLKAGKGTMNYVLPGGADSLVEGFWKKDTFWAAWEHPWQVVIKTVPTEVQLTKNNFRQVSLETWGPRSDGVSVSISSVVKGSYQDVINRSPAKTKGTVVTYTMVQFPLHFRTSNGCDIELNEPGEYLISFEIKDRR